VYCTVGEQARSGHEGASESGLKGMVIGCVWALSIFLGWVGEGCGEVLWEVVCP